MATPLAAMTLNGCSGGRPPNTLTQVIDFDGNFNKDLTTSWLEKRGMIDSGFDYSVVTVLGCQSSGKSTLLNEMFGTEFEVMDASRGRHQTTKGLWLGKDASSATLIIDVEGTDSKERGEDRLTFEHRAALFSLALADVVVVNMWYHDLGRYTASNYGLLKTVLAVNLELFQQQPNAPKTLLLFVIRDYSARTTPLERLRRMILDDIRQIWNEIKKPEAVQHKTADDFFLFETVGLSNREALPEQFSSDVAVLRQRFFKEFRPKHYTRLIPADGFCFYCKSVWETILKSSELDIPSQKEMLATYRCEEIKVAALTLANPQILDRLRAAQDGMSTDDVGWAKSIFLDALEAYNGPASRYQESVYVKKRHELVETLRNELQKVVDTHLSHVRQRIVTSASNALEMTCSSSEDSDLIGGVPRIEAWSRFSEKGLVWRTEAVARFDSAASSLTVELSQENEQAISVAFDSSHAKQALEEVLDGLLDKIRERQLHDFRKLLAEESAKRLISLEDLLDDASITSEKFWESASQSVKETKDVVIDLLFDPWAGLQHGCDVSQEQWTKEVGRECLRQLRAKVEHMVEWLPSYVVQRFKHFFELDAQGVPRQWQSMSSDKIKECFVTAREKALEIVEMFREMRVPIEEVLPEGATVDRRWTMPLLDDAKKQAAVSKALKQMQKACQEAQLIQATGGRATNVPLWMWGLLLAFGYNEIVAIVFSPLTMLGLLFLTAIGGVAYVTGNVRLPLQMSQQVLAMAASMLMPILGALQQQGALAVAAEPPASRPRAPEEPKKDS